MKITAQKAGEKVRISLRGGTYHDAKGPHPTTYIIQMDREADGGVLEFLGDSVDADVRGLGLVMLPPEDYLKMERYMRRRLKRTHIIHPIVDFAEEGEKA